MVTVVDFVSLVWLLWQTANGRIEYCKHIRKHVESKLAFKILNTGGFIWLLSHGSFGGIVAIGDPLRVHVLCPTSEMHLPNETIKNIMAIRIKTGTQKKKTLVKESPDPKSVVCRALAFGSFGTRANFGAKNLKLQLIKRDQKSQLLALQTSSLEAMQASSWASTSSTEQMAPVDVSQDAWSRKSSAVGVIPAKSFQHP